MTLVVREDDFKITSGEVNLYHSTSEEGRKKLGAFCPNCGTRVYHQPQWRPGTVSIKPGTLDDASWFEPQMHIWTKSKLPWVIIPEGVETHEAQP